VYTALPDLPNIEMFRCDRWHATTSVSSCAKRWRDQRNANVERRDSCHGCAIGEAHFGADPDRRSKIFGLPICNRCRRRSIRMISGRLCINCSNRAWELRRGRNSRGTKPRLVLDPKRIGLVINPGAAGEVAFDIAEPMARDSIELAIGALRVVDGGVAITQPRGGPALTLAELARRHGKKPTPKPPLLNLRRGRRTRVAVAA
jgi:hypothetical protein